MKKLFFIVLLGISITSCKKEYTCTCTFYWSNGTVGNTSSQTIKQKKSTAIKDCANKELQQVNNSNYSICTLKEK